MSPNWTSESAVIVSHEDLMLKTHDRRDATATLHLWSARALVLTVLCSGTGSGTGGYGTAASVRTPDPSRIAPVPGHTDDDDDEEVEDFPRRRWCCCWWWWAERDKTDAYLCVCVCVCVCVRLPLSLSDRSGLGAFCNRSARARARVCVCVIDLKGVSFLHPFYYDQNISSSSKVSIN